MQRLQALDHSYCRDDVKLPPRTWALALHLLTATKTNLAALELMRHLGVNYKIAWRVKHKVMQAMAGRENSRKFNGFVQIDDVYLGGERNGAKRGHGSETNRRSWWRCRPVRISPHRAWRSSSLCAASTTPR